LKTRFNIASAGKMFTAVAIGQLVDAGRLRFDEPIGRVLPDLSPDMARITVDQLLTHRSGLGDYLRPENREAIHSARTATDLLPLATSGPLQFAPGSRQQYSNSGFVVLGAIIEKLSGESYSQYVRAHVLDPARMETADLTGDVPRATALTRRNPDGTSSPVPRPAPVMGGNRASPAGGATATALDLIKFGEALRAGKLVSLRTLGRLWPPQVPGASRGEGKLSYGYGFARMDFSGGRWLVGHNGGSLGVNAEFELFPDEGYSLVALSNYDPPAATNAIAMARRAVLGEPTCPPVPGSGKTARPAS
jgi:CubicO group peptidase (beta-lactamase class C family)